MDIIQHSTTFTQKIPHFGIDTILRKEYNQLVFDTRNPKGGANLFNSVEFEIAMLRKGVKLKELADVLGVDISTMYRKIKNGGDFDREQIAKIMNHLDITDPNPIFFASELAQETKNEE